MLKLELNKDKPFSTTFKYLKVIWHLTVKLMILLIFFIGTFIVVKIMYWRGKVNGEIDGIVTKTKYIRIRKSIRIKLWFWMNLRWLCKCLKVDFKHYEKYYKDKNILRY